MTYIRKILIHIFLLTVIYVPKGLAEYENFETFATIFDFTVELRNDSDEIADYATTIQALFCPELPICNDEGTPNRTDLLGTLPEII